MKTAIFTVALGAAALLCAPHAAARTLQLADMRAIAGLEQPRISPDGRTIALVAVRGTRSSLLLVDAHSGRMRTIDHGPQAWDPRWSPDGSALAYLRADARGNLQVAEWRNHHVETLTQAPSGIRDLRWSPDGTAIAFAADDPPKSAPYFYAGDNDYTLTAPVPPTHLWIVLARGGPARRLTSGSWSVAPTDPQGVFSSQFTWAPSGRAIVFTRLRNTFSGDDEYSTLWRLDLTTHHLTPLSLHSAFELSPAYAPDGTLAYSYPRDGNYLAENTLRAYASGHDTPLAPQLDRNPGAAYWMPGRSAVLTCAVDGTLTRLYLLQDGRANAIPLGDLNVVCDTASSSTFDCGAAASAARNGTIAFLASDTHSARELYVVSRAGAPPRRLTHVNDFVRALDIGAMREISWKGPNGFRERGVLTLPARAVRGRRYPVLVLIHGGPGLSDVRSFAWETWPRAQLFAAHGYLVFQPNYRGSDGDGNRYMLAIQRDTVRGPSSDILAGLDAVKKLPYADPSRVAVSGWSYGGQLTSWLITQTHQWRAAVSGAAVNNEMEEYALSVTNVQDRYYLGISPFAPGGRAVYQANTPLTYARNVTTPTLIWGTTGDPVVPITQSYEFYHALHERGVPVRFAVFTAPTHGPSNERQTEDLMRLWIDWLDRWMK